MELQITEKIIPAVKFNKPEIEERLRSELAKYENLVVTEDSEKDIKKTKSELNKLKTDLNRFRIDAKNEISKPITAFENDVKNLTQLIEATIKPLDGGLKVIDQQRRDKKAEWVRQEVAKIAFEFGLNDEHSAKIDIKSTWLTKTCAESKITTDIKNIAEGLRMTQKQQEENKALIVESCQRLGESPISWLEMLKFNSPAYVLRLLNEKYAPKPELIAPEPVMLKPKIGELVEPEIISAVNPPVVPTNSPIREHIEPIQLCQEAIVGEVMTYRLELSGTRVQLDAIRKVMDKTGVTYTKI